MFKNIRRYQTEIILTFFAVFAVLFLFFPKNIVLIFENILLFLVNKYILFGILSIGGVFLWTIAIKRNKKGKRDVSDKPLFLEDTAIESLGKDVLNLKKDASRFAKNVLNNGSIDPIVFGLDSPWGSGKSSYLNFCQEIWGKEKDVIVFKFKPVLYDTEKQDLLILFIDNLLSFLKSKRINISSLNTAFRKYLISIKKFSFLGIDIDVSHFFNNSSEEALNDIKEKIKNLDRKIIIIIDDLDRVYLNDIKIILGIVRNILYVPNITFVLCYDTSNINTFETIHKIVHSTSYKSTEDKDFISNGYSRADHQLDNQKINAYFEKIVQVKKMLIPNKNKLKEFFIEKLKEMEIQKLNIKDTDVEYFFNSKNYPDYYTLLGDIRKIKRVINFFRTLKASKVNFEEWDIRFKYLVQFILIYINYPHIFRKIYNMETGGSNGFFSVEYETSGSSFTWKNSNRFTTYLRSVSKEEKFLLEELFLINDGKYKGTSMDDEKFKRYSPMFNGGMSGRNNLEDYLRIIVEQRASKRWTYDNFHFSKTKLLDRMSIEDIFKEDGYQISVGEYSRECFFRVLAKSSDLNYINANKAIKYIARNLPKYSLASNPSSIYDAARHHLLYLLLDFLIKKGWDENNKWQNNFNDIDIPESALVTIIYRLFGKNEFMQEGIFNDLLSKKRGILGFYDAIRLLEWINGNDSSYIITAISKYEKDKKIDIKRDATQKIFQLFKDRYIIKKKNIFEEIDILTEKDLLGDFIIPIKKQFQNNNLDIIVELTKIKTGILNYLIYYFGQSDLETAGHYNEKGVNNQRTISRHMKKYLFDVCFSPRVDNTKNEINFVFFVNLLLQNLYNDPWKNIYTPKLSEFQKLLGNVQLKKYWKQNGVMIEKYMKTLPEESMIYTYNYAINYKDYLNELFKELNK